MSSPRPSGRSAARPTASSAPRALRVAVLVADSIVSEHVIQRGTAFTLGQSIRNLVALPLPHLPRRWQLLELVERGVLVRLAPGMEARVAVGDEVLDRAALDRLGARTRAATLVTVPAGAHGKVSVGEIRVLFQETAALAPVPTPRLPRAVRGSLGDRVDRRMAAFAAASLLVHGGVMVAAAVNDPAGTPTAAERAARFVPETVAIIDADDPMLDALLDPVPDLIPDAARSAPDRTTPAPPPTTTPAPGATTPIAGDRRPPAADPRTPPAHAGAPDRLDEDPVRLADALFGDDDGPGNLRGGLADRRPGTLLARQLDELRDARAQVAIGNPAGDRLRDGGGPRPGTVAPPAVVGPGGIGRVDDDKVEATPRTRIDLISRPTPGVDGDVDGVLAKIRTTYMSGLQRCYKRALASDPQLAGKVALAFTVDEKGAVRDATARGSDAGFGDCVEGLIARWSFAPVVDGGGDATEVDLGITLQLSQ